MDILFLLKIAAIGIIVAVLYQVLARSGREEYAMLTALSGIIVILAMLLPKILDLINSVESIFNL
ncbi:MAG: stage III sporulation protein AC [Clostridiales bacterium]|nr:stage III sporulation protein AC [Clostridia bacterium]MCR4563766.1 stage III sporulation protein AC [Clostridiales bacterium]